MIHVLYQDDKCPIFAIGEGVISHRIIKEYHEKTQVDFCAATRSHQFVVSSASESIRYT
jgi:hypothetical protein